MNIAIALEIGSPNSRLHLVKQTFQSIMENIGTGDYKIIVAIAPHINDEIKN
jgi:hypothetical protein